MVLFVGLSGCGHCSDRLGVVSLVGLCVCVCVHVSRIVRAWSFE